MEGGGGLALGVGLLVSLVRACMAALPEVTPVPLPVPEVFGKPAAPPPAPAAPAPAPAAPAAPAPPAPAAPATLSRVVFSGMNLSWN